MPGPVRFDECLDCHGWGRLLPGHYCPPCGDWKDDIDGTGLRCERCGHKGRLNRNRFCRLCLITIRTTDKTWITDPQSHRPTQLLLLLARVRLPNARGLNRGPSARLVVGNESARAAQRVAEATSTANLGSSPSCT